VVPDEPIAIEADVTGSQRWEPKNFDGKFEGPIRLRTALVKSKNMVSIRILDAIGPKYAQDYVTRFGFEPERHPPYLTMALGSGTVTPWQMARAYAVFANGGYLVQPYFIHKIVDDRGNLLGEARPQRAGDESLRVIDTRNAFIMDSLMQDVARVGTGARAASLGRKDVAGKTGTTNEFIDAWFAGYIPSLVGISWVGFDQPRTLGRNQTGGLVALPIWVGYMQKVQKAVPEMQRIVPEGVVTGDTVDFDPSGLGEAKQVPEYFYREFVPKDDTPFLPPVFVPPAENRWPRSRPPTRCRRSPPAPAVRRCHIAPARGQNHKCRLARKRSRERAKFRAVARVAPGVAHAAEGIPTSPPDFAVSIDDAFEPSANSTPRPRPWTARPHRDPRARWRAPRPAARRRRATRIRRPSCVGSLLPWAF
jgi:penicillin-binding protein 1A